LGTKIYVQKLYGKKGCKKAHLAELAKNISSRTYGTQNWGGEVLGEIQITSLGEDSASEGKAREKVEGKGENDQISIKKGSRDHNKRKERCKGKCVKI